jgi:OmpR family response regulator RpaB
LKHIAIIDDDLAIHQILRPIFEMDGFAVSSALTGEAGMELFHRCQPDLIILDVMLPDVDGWTVCRTLRQRTDVPIIMLTALGFEEDRL